jgi:chemotaxis protein CheZ
MIEVWGGLDAFKDMAGPVPQPEAVNENDDRSLLNGPKLDHDLGHVSQNDIDALFD